MHILPNQALTCQPKPPQSLLELVLTVRKGTNGLFEHMLAQGVPSLLGEIAPFDSRLSTTICCRKNQLIVYETICELLDLWNTLVQEIPWIHVFGRLMAVLAVAVLGFFH